MSEVTINKNKGVTKYTPFNFGLHGWIIILFCLMMFWFYVGMVNDGSNITAPAVAEKLGVSVGDVLNGNSIAGIVGVLFFIVVGRINTIYGPRVIAAVTMIVAALAYIAIGYVGSLTMYTIAMCFVVGGIMSAGYIAGGTLVARWFPKRKGVVMGYTTMGHNLASAFYVPIAHYLVSNFDLQQGLLFLGVAASIIAVGGFLLVRNTPQEREMLPDNATQELYDAEYETHDHLASEWTVAKLLKTKELWISAITTGGFQICSVGVMTQLVTRNMSLGFTQSQAIYTMTVVALIGVFGSWLIGIFDDKFGTRRTMIGFGIWYATALLINITNTTWGTYLSIFMIGMGIGGSANFTTSLPTSIFGRHEFDMVNSVIFPLQGLITALSFAINGFVLNLTGDLRYAYMVFAGVGLAMGILVSFVDEHKYNKDFKKH